MAPHRTWRGTLKVKQQEKSVRGRGGHTLLHTTDLGGASHGKGDLLTSPHTVCAMPHSS